MWPYNTHTLSRRLCCHGHGNDDGPSRTLGSASLVSHRPVYPLAKLWISSLIPSQIGSPVPSCVSCQLKHYSEWREIGITHWPLGCIDAIINAYFTRIFWGLITKAILVDLVNSLVPGTFGGDYKNAISNLLMIMQPNECHRTLLSEH